MNPASGWASRPGRGRSRRRGGELPEFCPAPLPNPPVLSRLTPCRSVGWDPRMKYFLPGGFHWRASMPHGKRFIHSSRLRRDASLPAPSAGWIPHLPLKMNPFHNAMRSLAVMLPLLLAALLPFRSRGQDIVITPAFVTTTSQGTAFGAGGKDNLLNSSGLSGTGSVETWGHDNAGDDATMWHAGPVSGDLGGGATGSPPAVNTQVIEFDLGANHDLTGIHVWNYNRAGFTGRGVKGVAILTSSGTAGVFTPLTTAQFTQGTGLPGLAAQLVPISAGNVRRVRFCHSDRLERIARRICGSE
jgi:hypothetical protein